MFVYDYVFFVWNWDSCGVEEDSAVAISPVLLVFPRTMVFMQTVSGHDTLKSFP